MAEGYNYAGVRKRRLPDKKAELHVHLEGSIAPETLMAIDSSLTREEIESNLTCTSFAQFLQGYIWVSKKLERPEHYALATRHLLESLASQGVTYAEVTLSAGVVLWKQQDLASVYEAVWRESERSSVQTFWILDAIRQFGPEKGMAVAEFAVSRRDQGTVAYGIGSLVRRRLRLCARQRATSCVPRGRDRRPRISLGRSGDWSGTNRAWHRSSP